MAGQSAVWRSPLLWRHSDWWKMGPDSRTLQLQVGNILSPKSAKGSLAWRAGQFLIYLVTHGKYIWSYGFPHVYMQPELVSSSLYFPVFHIASTDSGGSRNRVLGFGVHLVIYLYVQSSENLTSALKTADACIMPVDPTMYLLAPVRLRCHVILMNLHLCYM